VDNRPQSGSRDSAARRRAGLAALLLLCGAFAAGYVYLHVEAGYTMPLPWDDEALFMWPAISFWKHNSLYAPQICPGRELLWMPPVYMLLMGTLFKVTGFSLAMVRVTSMLFMLGAFACLLAMAWQYGRRALSVVLIGLFLLTPYAVAAGNFARMEALLILTVCAGFLLLSRGRLWYGMSVLAFSPLIHPNGLYFFLGGLGLCLYLLAYGRARWRPRKAELAVFGAVLAAWVAYGVHVLVHWEWFVLDMTFQFQRKGERQFGYSIAGPRALSYLLLAGLCLLYCLAHDLRVGSLLMLSIPAFVSEKVGQEIWYYVYTSLFFLCLSLVLIHVAWDMAEKAGPRGRRRLWSAVRYVAVVLVAFWLWRGEQVQLPWQVRRNMVWMGMPASFGRPYLTDEDERVLRSFLATLRGLREDGPVSVQFFPRADGLLLHEEDGPELRLVCPYQHEGRADVYVVHDFPLMAPMMREEMERVLREEAQIDVSDPSRLLHQRDGTDRWYYRIGSLDSQPPPTGPATRSAP